jgi:hypothetical protein
MTPVLLSQDKIPLQAPSAMTPPFAIAICAGHKTTTSAIPMALAKFSVCRFTFISLSSFQQSLDQSHLSIGGY